MLEVSIVSPIFNEAENLEPLCERIRNALKGVTRSYEIVLVENGSTDRSLEIIRSLRKKDKRIKYVCLSRNFGHQGGILAGLRFASGRAVISLDGDLQHPPEILPEMIRLWREGNQVVYTTKQGRADHDNWRFLPSALFYRLMNLFTEVKLSYGQSDFRLLDRVVVDLINAIPEKNKFLRGLTQWVGFRQAEIRYMTEARQHGRSKFRLKNYINFAIDGIFSFSTLPLRAITYAGLCIALVSGVYMTFVIALYALTHLDLIRDVAVPPGWSTLATAVVFFGAVQMVGMGVIGEYIGRIYNQVKGRPDYIVHELQIKER